jgi:serine/threonine protein kinase
MVLQTLSEDQEETTPVVTPTPTPTPTPVDLDAEKIAAVKVALNKAREKVKASFADTKLGIGEKEQLFPQFHKDELKIGNVLGKGGFGTVSEILAIRIKKDAKHNSFSFRTWANIDPPPPPPPPKHTMGVKIGSKKKPKKQHEQKEQAVVDEPEYVPELDPDFDETAFQTKKFMQDFVLGKGGAARYAIKEISPEVKANAKKFIRAAMDMATETHFLSVLNHQHIIKMRAVGEIDMFDKNYFIVMDRLYDTLDERIDDWQEELKNSTTCLAMFKRGSKTKKKRLFAERLTVARNIASAIQHLHELNVIYRDMKPENIGFDVKNVVKVFDFGLAKELHPEDKLANDTYRLTGNTGSIRYMAPEVANRHTYNFSVDVYSFGIMLWETVAMEIPFKFFNQAMIREMVCNFGTRPDLDDSWPEDLQKLIKSCWSDSFKRRPDFSEVIRVLDSEISKVETELSSGSGNNKKK